MTSILDLHAKSNDIPDPAPPTPVVAESAEKAAEPEEEFEFVVGRRQIASLSFVSVIVLMTCVAGAYVVGKSMSPKPVPAVAEIVREPDPPPITLDQEPVPEQPLFAEPKAGSVYIQMGAVEKGVAVIFAEGLRKRGLASFVAPGPSDKIFRVLIGPLSDSAAYQKAKGIVDQIGLSSFARKFPN